VLTGDVLPLTSLTPRRFAPRPARTYSPLVSPLTGLHAIASRYDAFLVDLYGVVHDGTRPFDGGIDTLRELASAKRRVVFVTNTSRAGDVVAGTLATMAITPDLYASVVSSGDITRAALASRDPLLFSTLPASPRGFHLGDPSFVPWLFELGLSFVDELADADLVIASGAPLDDAALARTKSDLAPLAARDVPLVCTNPDRVIPTASGLTLGPGAVAAAYASLGGRVFMYGKPHAPIYAAARALLSDVPSERIVAIGDLLDTDIRGARTAGIASVLVTATGGHAAALATTTLDALCAAAGVAPDFVLTRFAW
jgi:HAD superfamily hydrolase (TIGR01459 family)